MQKQETVSGLIARRVQQLDEITGRVNDLQHNTSSLLEAGSDPHQLVTLKASISELQSEIKELDISSGESRSLVHRKAAAFLALLLPLLLLLPYLTMAVLRFSLPPATTSHRLIAYRLLNQEQARKLRRVRSNRSNKARSQSEDNDNQSL